MKKEEIIEWIMSYEEDTQDYELEKKKIKEALGNDLYDFLKNTGCVLAGGAITSLFTGKEVNDYDIYFTKPNALGRVVTQFLGESVEDYLFSYSQLVCFVTEKSILTKRAENGALVQFIHYKVHPDVDSIFKSFDFTINMGAFDFGTEKFVFHKDFFKHNSQRVLRFNDKTDYPFISLLRSNKYKDRGYKISISETLRIALTCAATRIDSWDSLIDQIGSMYGVDKKNMFDTTKEFSIQEACAQLEKVGLMVGNVKAKSYTIDGIVKEVENSLDENFMNWVNSGIWSRELYNFEHSYVKVPIAVQPPTTFGE